MGELHDKVIAFQDDAACMGDLARSCGIRTQRDASDAYGSAVPTVVEGLVAAIEDDDVADGLLRSARALSWLERSEPDKLFSTIEHRIGADIMEKMYGPTLPAVRAEVAERAGIAEVSARGLLEITGLVTLATLTGVTADEVSQSFFIDSIRRERDSLPSTAASASAVETDDSSPAVSSPDATDAGERPADTAEATTGHESSPAKAEADKEGALAAASPLLVENDLSEERGRSAVAADGKIKMGLLAGGVAAALALAGFGIWASSNGGDGDETVADQTTADEDTQGTEATAVEEDEAATSSTLDGAGSQVPTGGASESEIVSLAIPMFDIEDPDSDATGVLAFDLNTVTGEVCYTVESSNIEGPYRSHIHAGGYGVKGGIVVDLGPLESGDVGCVDNLPVDTNAILADRAGHYAELHDVSEEWTIRGQLSETIDGDVVSINVPMTDAEAVSPEASGVLAFEFNTVTGEVCYSVESSNIEGPYRSHIHVGPAGVKGGIVVDLGPLESGDVGCVDNLPVDTNAILADRAGHYAELHDVSEEWTIRGQLSETTVGETPAELATVIDTEGGGARIVLDGGTIYLEGDVADQETADELVASLDGIDSSTEIVDNLNVQADAPVPSGRVVIADALFFDVNSAAVKEIDSQSLNAITTLAKTRDDWILTVVGHTDSSGPDVYNLELSLQRATALRDLLAEQGIPEENLRIRGAGETAPIGDNTTEAGRAQNRRIEFEFSPKE